MALTLLVIAVGAAPAQEQPARNILGTVTAVKAETGALEIKPDKGPLLSIQLSAKTAALRVEPGQTSLKNATVIKPTDVAVGDRVLVTIGPGDTEARRIIVMSATDIAKRNEADREDWIKRGVSGIVAAKKGNQITLKIRTLQGPMDAIVTVGDRTGFKRYAPDSVKFADALPSNLDAVSVGDQMRARGQKSEDGLKVAADEVVFGTFLIRAGTITAVNAESNEITVKDLGNNKPLIIKVTADSQLKKMPDFRGMMGGGGRPGFAPGREGPPTAGGSGPGGFRGPAGGARDISQMLEHMPATTLSELKPGETVVVSSTKGARNDQITAIMLVANADLLIQMAQAANGNNGSNLGMNNGMMGMQGLGGFEMPTMIP